VKKLYASGRPYHAPPLPGAPDGAQRLRALGYALVIVTAREPHEMVETQRWLRERFPVGTFEATVCNGAKEDAFDREARVVATTLSKLEVPSPLCFSEDPI
jgi:phosphoglycolate phosphatase-like HAD superfamily hydrolase